MAETRKKVAETAREIAETKGRIAYTRRGNARTSEHRLPQQAGPRMLSVPAGARIGEIVVGHRRQSERFVEFAS